MGMIPIGDDNSGRTVNSLVNYAAHVGGFIAGLILVKVFAAGRLVPGARRG